MKVFSTRTHAVIDYLTALLLIVAPYVLGFADATAAQWVPQIVGAAILASSLMTDYELGVARVIPMPAHIGLDMILGALLAASPWLFGFADRVFWPHLIVGLLDIAIAMTTRSSQDLAAVRSR
ncbi:hypothetical protein GXW71_08900 [Roseomonas hellenica]|uniref:SPW repeat-containing integral membrane domain-containing protein n=1 Tax=Plastoroseomonas hellenica TaxID=2687306 RepID=A0ABS5EX34_9PROT|nr:SPW repeat protein [Plastoroseomonas hellenica]MBR0664470.1 hypothetical protein [Plastoroseomonas hellenica]